MSEAAAITTLFLDIGGVLLTNGWDRHARRRAADAFDLDYEEMDERHHLTFDTYEEGKLTLDEYLERVVFYQSREVTPEAFKSFMFAQSHPLRPMIDLIRRLRERYALRTAAVSNEGRELTAYRIVKFDLKSIIDFFVVSSFVHIRKPDADLYRMALDTAQVEPHQALYIDDRALLVQVAAGLGIRGIHHHDIDTTRAALAHHGLTLQ